MKKVFAALAGLLALAFGPAATAGVIVPPFNPVNSIPYTANLDPALFPHFRQAIANTRNGGGDTTILFVGTSITLGVQNADSYSNIRQADLTRFLAVMGVSGLPTTDDNQLGDGGAYAHSETLPAINSNVTISATWTGTGNTQAIGGFYLSNTSNTTDTVCYQSNHNADHANLFYITTPGAGGIAWNTDAGTYSSTISENATRSVTSTAIAVGSASTTHKVCVKATSNTAYVLGVDFYNSTISSVRLLNAGISGVKAYDTINSASYSATPYAWSPGNALGVTPFAPNLCVVEIGANDANQIYLGVYTLANFTSGLQAVITNCQKSGDVLLVTNFPTNPTTTSQAVQNQVRATIQALAASNNVGLVDWVPRVGGNYATAVALGWQSSSSNYHPTTAGHEDWATFMQQAFRQIIGY